MGDVLDFPQMRTCFLCTHYGMSRCELYDEPVQSEIYSARDCPGYEPE